MFTKKNTIFLGIISMFLVLFLTTGCQHNVASDDTNGDYEEVMLEEENDINQEETVMEEEVEEETDNLFVNTPSSDIVFEDLNWNTYTNSLLGYSVEYPTIVNIMGNNLDQRVEFTGPLSDNDWWPMITISHYSNSFYRPSAGVSVAEWVKPFPGYKSSENITIAGLDAVHYAQARSPQAWATDYYYFIKDGQLYNITIIHSNDKQDWQLYNKILDSFTFNDLEN